MNNEQFQQLETLRKASWDAIVSRREYEWRVSIAFWTLLGAFVAGLVTTKINLSGCYSFILWLFPMLLGGAHLVWLWGLFRAYTIDKTEEAALREAMRNVASYSEPQAVTDLRKPAADRSKGILWNWNHAPQVWTTLAFTLVAIFVAYKAVNQPPQPTPPAAAASMNQAPDRP